MYFSLKKRIKDLIVDIFPVPITSFHLLEKDCGILLKTSKKSRWVFTDQDSYDILIEVLNQMCLAIDFNEKWDLTKHLFKSDFGNVLKYLRRLI